MSFKQCPGCEAEVAETKAYCPDCGTPMDEEQKRSKSSEYDALSKTQNLNQTSQLRLLEQLDLSSFFTEAKQEQALKNGAALEAKPAQPEKIEETPKPAQQPQIPVQPNQVVENKAKPNFSISGGHMSKTISLVPQASFKDIVVPKEPPPVKASPLPEEKPKISVPDSPKVGTPKANSNKTLYIIGGSIILLLLILAIAGIILGVLYLNYWK